MEFFGFTLGMVGKVMVAYTALMVHHRVRKEHKIDVRVFITMRREQVVGIFGIGLIVIGYFLEVYVRFWV